MDIELGWLETEGINVKEGMGYTGGKEKYVSALQRYLKGYDTNRKAVEELQSAGDTEGYMIKVHALKSNSRMIGATEVAEAFERLETAARDGDTGYIEDNTDDALEKYDRLIDIIRPVGEMEDVHVAGELSAAEAKETADKLMEALDEFDDELSSQLVSKLAGYPFRMTQRQKLDEAVDNIGNFLYDEALELIKEIYTAIE